MNFLSSTREALSILNSIGLFKTELNELRITSVNGNNLDTIQVNHDEYSRVAKTINKLQTNINTTLDALNVSLPLIDITEYVIYIKLPEVKDFDDLLDITEKLKKAIQLPIALEGVNDELTIRNFDTGSKWFEIVVKSAISIQLIASISWSGAVIYKKVQEGKMYEEYSKKIELENIHLEALVTASKKQLDLLVETEAKLIQNEILKNNDNENLERLKLSIKTMAELIEKGAEIKPALVAPEQVTNLFPDYTKLMLIESKQKMLGQ